jgi:hypothetical protein
MVPRIILISIIVIVLAGVFVNFSPQGNMLKPLQNIQASFTTVVYAGELDEIRKAVNEFLVLREIKGTAEGKALAAKIDKRMNDLELVKMNCNQEISTHELAFEKNPYEKIQQICPTLKNISLTKAIELFRLI